MNSHDNEETVDLTTDPKGGPAHELHHLGDRWWVFLALGCGMFVLGLIAIGSAYNVSKAVSVLFGLVMLAAGIAQIITSFWTGKWGGFFLQLAVGVLYSVGGLFLIRVRRDCSTKLLG